MWAKGEKEHDLAIAAWVFRHRAVLLSPNLFRSNIVHAL